MSQLVRISFPLRLVRARLGAGGERLVLVALGIVAGAAVLAAVLAGRLVMQDRALALATAQLGPGDREVQIVWSGAVDQFSQLDATVSPRVRAVTGEQPAAAMLFREASVQGRLVNLRAANDLGRFVRLTSGRLPAVCVPSHCEVLRLKGKGPIPSTPALHLIEVGRAVLKPGASIAPFVLPTPPTEQVARAIRYHTPQPSPVVIANGVAGLSGTTELETFYRSYAWILPLGRGDVHPWDVNAFTDKVRRLTAELESNSDEFEVVAPTEQLAAATASSRAASRRLLLLGGEGGALLLAFTILAASALRRDVTEARRRLTWFGARRWQVELHTLAESCVLAVAGTAVGWIVGGAVAAVIASRAGSPAGAVIGHALLSTSGLVAAAAVAAAAGLLLYATVRAPAVRVGRHGFTALDAAACGAVAVVLVGWARGSVDAQQLAGGNGTSAFLLLVPALIVFAVAVLCARLLAPTLRAVGRAGRRGPISLRLAAASLARHPGHAAIAATFLVASLGLALFAVAYRSTLLQGQRDEAAYAVPAPYVLTEDFSQLVPVLHGAPARTLPSAPTPVVRLSGNVPSGATFSFLALPAHALPAVQGWRPDFAHESLAALGPRLTPRPANLRLLSLPPGRRFTLPVTATGDDVGVRAFFRSRLGDYVAVSLGRTRANQRSLLQGRIPFRHATLAGLELDILNGGRLTANAGTGIQPSAKGELRFGAPRVNGAPVRGGFERWVGTGGVGGSAAGLGYVLTPDRTGVYRPAQPTDGLPLPVLATPGIAAVAGPHGIVPLDIEGESVPARIVGVVQRFPSIIGDAVVADIQQAGTRLDTLSAGLGTPDELWLSSAAPPHEPQVIVQSQAETLARLQSDPLARGSAPDARRHRVGRAVAGAARTGPLGRERPARRPRRALRPRSTGRVARDHPGAPAPAGAAGGSVRDRRRARARRDPLRARHRTRLGDRERRRARAAAATLARPPLARTRGARLHRARRAVRWCDHEPARPGARARGRGDGMTAAIELKDVFRVHSTPEGDAAALQGLSLRVAEGEVLAVLGPSGSGKSTLLRLLAGLERPSAGLVRVHGEDLGKLPARGLARYRSSQLGYADQHYSRALAPELSARDLVAVQLGLRGTPRAERLRRADDLLERVGLADKRTRHPGQLSGGEQQRVALCAALAHRPAVFLADEPTGELDAATADQVYDVLSELVREHGCTTVIVSHDPESARIADRIVRIRDGRVSEEWSREAGDSDTIVVGRGGWLRLPEELLLRAGIGAKATARFEGGKLTVEPAAGDEVALQVPGAQRAPGTSPGRVVVAARGLCKSYGATPVLAELDVELHSGRLHAVTGPSGSGKTTLLHVLAGLELPDSGEVVVDGVELAPLDRAGRAALRRAKIAYVGQQAGLVAHLSAVENVELALALRGVEEGRFAALDALESVGLEERATQRVGRLSQGERARVAIARAIASRPAVLLADEPTSRLDGANAISVAILLAQLARSTSAAVVCATHDPLVIEQSESQISLS